MTARHGEATGVEEDQGGQADGREGTARVWEHFVYVKSVMETGHQNITKPWKRGYFSSLT